MCIYYTCGECISHKIINNSNTCCPLSLRYLGPTLGETNIMVYMDVSEESKLKERMGPISGGQLAYYSHEKQKWDDTGHRDLSMLPLTACLWQRRIPSSGTRMNERKAYQKNWKKKRNFSLFHLAPLEGLTTTRYVKFCVFCTSFGLSVAPCCTS